MRRPHADRHVDGDANADPDSDDEYLDRGGHDGHFDADDSHPDGDVDRVADGHDEHPESDGDAPHADGHGDAGYGHVHVHDHVRLAGDDVDDPLALSDGDCHLDGNSGTNADAVAD
jgi:hypothetical protein